MQLPFRDPKGLANDALLTCVRFMPPTGPICGIPRVAIVFARLKVKGEDRGIRPFVVMLSDGKEMCTGITAR